MAIGQIGYIHLVARDIDPPNRIRELREAKGLTQAELARLANVTPSALNKVELGSRGLDQQWMRRLAPLLDVAPADLLPRQDNPDILSDDERRLIEGFRYADARGQRDFRRVAESLLDYKAEPQDKAA